MLHESCGQNRKALLAGLGLEDSCQYSWRRTLTLSACIRNKQHQQQQQQKQQTTNRSRNRNRNRNGNRSNKPIHHGCTCSARSFSLMLDGTSSVTCCIALRCPTASLTKFCSFPSRIVTLGTCPASCFPEEGAAAMAGPNSSHSTPQVASCRCVVLLQVHSNRLLIVIE